MTPSGVVLYPKPAGITSHDVVARVRRELRDRLGERVKVGHAGTLDPFATGLLLVLVGPATRAQRFFMALPKTYRVIARLGWRSTTGDPEGELVHTGQIPESLQIPLGDQMQRPPAKSDTRPSSLTFSTWPNREAATAAVVRPPSPENSSSSRPG